MENVAIVKSLLEALGSIRTPLMFWSFCALLVYLSFKTFSKSNLWFQELSKSIVLNLTKTGLYKVVRLFIITIIVLIILAFLAPVINNWIDKNYDLSFLEGKIDEVKKK